MNIERLRSQLLGIWYLALLGLLRCAPVRLASATGGLLVRMNVRSNRPEVIAGARKNLAAHRPRDAMADREASINRFIENVGRVMAEFAVLARISDEGRIKLIGNQEVFGLAGREPIIGILLHTGNWELFGPVLRRAGIHAATFYEPPSNRVARKIAEYTRRASGLELLTPNPRGFRNALAQLQARRIVAIFGDEVRAGTLAAPLFGRPPHSRCNLALAAKLARRTAARIVIAYSKRTGPCHFEMHFSAPFKLSDANQTVLADVADLNEKIEPIILSLLDQWYYLNDTLGDVAQHEGQAGGAVHAWSSP